MSDCFDHMVDAFESYDRAMEDDCRCILRKPKSEILTGIISHETQKAILLSNGSSKVWLPKSQIKIKNLEDNKVSVEVPYFIMENLKPIKDD